MNPLAEKIRAEIRNRGPISFARFMEWALYCPVYGYYEKEEDTIGRRGDYYTSVSVGPLFGELLAMQFSGRLQSMLEATDQGPLLIVEAGAHNGALARDILTWLATRRPSLLAAMEYCIVEPSERRQTWQRRTLREFLHRVRWVKNLTELATGRSGAGILRGVLFCNELLDAMPVHRLGWDVARSSWFEWGVTLLNESFAWTRLGQVQFLSSEQRAFLDLEPRARLSRQPQLWPEELLAALPDGFTTEVCPSAEAWWGTAARVLDQGKMVAIDYGFTTEEWLGRGPIGGTLRAYHSHRLADSVLDDPGDQDITAHVNFSSIRAAGESAGLQTDALLTQERFLTRIAASETDNLIARGEWDALRRRQFQTLTHPDHLGCRFKVLVQSREPIAP